MDLKLVPEESRVLLFDLDNTLIECTKYYIDVEDAFVRRTISRLHLPEKFVRSLVQTIDYESAKLNDGFNRRRFPRSFAAASLALDTIAGHAPDVERAKQEEVLAATVFTAPYEPYPGALAAVDKLRARGFRIALVTKGDPDIQNYKINKHSLGDLFDLQNIFVVPTKTKDTYSHILGTLDADPSKCVMIGDSLKDDIAPTKELGLTTIHIMDSHHPWKWEDTYSQPDYTVSNVVELSNQILHQN